MGQRLVLTIKDNKKDLMKIYYHWSGYTSSTQQVLLDLAGVIRDCERAGKTVKETLLEVIKTVETPNREAEAFMKKNFPDLNDGCYAGGIDGGPKSKEWKHITSLFPEHKFNENPNRNEGLITMSPQGMEDAQSYSEGDASINIDTGECINDTVFVYSSKDDYLDSSDDCDELLQNNYDDAYDLEGDNPFVFNYRDDTEMLNVARLTGIIFSRKYDSGVAKDTKNDKVYEMIG